MVPQHSFLLSQVVFKHSYQNCRNRGYNYFELVPYLFFLLQTQRQLGWRPSRWQQCCRWLCRRSVGGRGQRWQLGRRRPSLPVLEQEQNEPWRWWWSRLAGSGPWWPRCSVQGTYRHRCLPRCVLWPVSTRVCTATSVYHGVYCHQCLPRCVPWPLSTTVCILHTNNTFLSCSEISSLHLQFSLNADDFFFIF